MDSYYSFVSRIIGFYFHSIVLAVKTDLYPIRLRNFLITNITFWINIIVFKTNPSLFSRHSKGTGSSLRTKLREFSG